MSKIVLDEVTSTTQVSKINENFTKLETALNDKVLYRDNPSGEPNTLVTDVDVNGMKLYNLPAPVLQSQAARLQDVTDAIASANTAVLTSFTPYGTVSATNVQGAIQEVVSDLAASSGSSLVGFSQGGTGAISTSVQTHLRQLVKTPQNFGCIGDGVVNDTVNFQKALDAINAAGGGVLYVPKGTYSLGIINWKSNVSAIFETGTVFQAINNIFTTNDRFFNFVDISNVVIEANGATIRMDNEYSTGEQRHNIFIIGASNIRINNLNSNDSGGDGFYVGRSGGAGTHSKNIVFDNCNASHNRRNNSSIVSADGCMILGGLYSNAIGTAPEAGIDIEPNDSLDVMRNIKVWGVSTSGNHEIGLSIVIGALGTTTVNNVSVDVRSYTSIADGNNIGARGAAAIRIVQGSGIPFKVNGTIVIDGVQITNPVSSGVRFDRIESVNLPVFQMKNVSIINPGYGAPAPNEDKCGLVIWGNNISGKNFGNVNIENLRVFDTRGVQATYSPVYIYSTAGGTGVGQADGIVLKDVMGVGITPLSNRGHVLVLPDMTNSSVTYTQDQVVLASAFASNDATVMRGYAGYTIAGGGANIIGLPKASTNLGLMWTVRNTDGATLQVRPNATDTIAQYGLFAGNDVVLSRIGAEASFKLVSGNGVSTPTFNGLANRALGYNNQGLIIYKSAAPVANAWTLGDRCFNSNPTVGQPKSWVCTASGTPGTWVSEGNL